MAALAGSLKPSDLQEAAADEPEEPEEEEPEGPEDEEPEDEEGPVAKKPAGRRLKMRKPAAAKDAAVRQKPACNLRRPAAATAGDDDDEGDGKRSQPKMRKLLQMMDSLPLRRSRCGSRRPVIRRAVVPERRRS